RRRGGGGGGGGRVRCDLADARAAPPRHAAPRASPARALAAARGAAMTGRAPRIVVAGGGLAGIAAALHCADAGASVRLLEARPRLGGATWSTEREGLRVDNGQHVFLRCCTAYRALLRRLGVGHLAPIQRRLAIPVLAPRAPPAWIPRGA